MAKVLANDLSVAERPLSSIEFIAIIYCNIVQIFHSIITALNLWAKPDSFYELHGQLVTHEILIESGKNSQ